MSQLERRYFSATLKTRAPVCDPADMEDCLEQDAAYKRSDPDNDGDVDPANDGASLEGRSIEGYAIVFNSPSVDLGGFTEIVMPGALTETLADGHNIYSLWAHRDDTPLGSTLGGKLTLTVDATGLFFTLDASRLTPAQLDAVKDGEMRCSFGFTVDDQTWEEVKDDDGDYSVKRYLNKVSLYEVSLVISPAYEDTTAALRSMNEWRNATGIAADNKYSEEDELRILSELATQRLGKR